MDTVYIEPARDEAVDLVRGAISAQAARLELALEAARRRFLPFVEKYGVSSHHFLARMSVEDLVGGEDEYLTWAGEYRLYLRLEDRFADFGSYALPALEALRSLEWT